MFKFKDTYDKDAYLQPYRFVAETSFKISLGNENRHKSLNVIELCEILKISVKDVEIIVERHNGKLYNRKLQASYPDIPIFHNYKDCLNSIEELELISKLC